MPKKFLTVNEVAKIIGVTSLTVRNWDKKGRLLAYRNPFNNYRMYKVEDVENLLKQIESSKGSGFARIIGQPGKPKIRKLKIETD